MSGKLSERLQKTLNWYAGCHPHLWASDLDAVRALEAALAQAEADREAVVLAYGQVCRENSELAAAARNARREALEWALDAVFRDGHDGYCSEIRAELAKLEDTRG
jgi:hypothetical protein